MAIACDRRPAIVAACEPGIHLTILSLAMPMRDGERVTIHGSTGTPYQLSRDGSVYACTCPAWHKQRAAAAVRTCKHLRAHLGDDHEDARVGSSRIDAAQARAARSAQKAPRDLPALRRQREAALRDAVARFPAVAEHMQRVYGMPLPRHIAHAAGFWLGLTADERSEAWAYFGCGLFGVTEWFEPDGLSRTPGTDERLHARYRRDPPEFVTVFSGNSDGGHWGLWYDDPRELPRLIAHNWARDDAETGPCQPTLLATLRHQFNRQDLDDHEWPHAARVIAWLDEVHVQELAAHRDERIGPPLSHTQHCLGGMDPVVAGARVPADFAGYEAQRARLDAYRNDIPRVRTWLAQAEQELQAGEPLRALYLGRELHWFDDDPLREEVADLTIRAYQSIGRHALAEVLRAHTRERDLAYVNIYVTPPPPPLVEAAAAADDVALARSLAEPVDASTLVAALGAAKTIAALDLLLPRVDADAAAGKLGSVVAELAQLRQHQLDTAAHEAMLEHLLARAIDVGPAFTAALRSEQSALALRLVERVDLARADDDGMLPLHRAAATGAVDIVRQLLARGAGPRELDARGKTAADYAEELWQTRPRESVALTALLLPKKPAPPPSTELEPGDRVVHAKFGPGRVTARENSGEAAKLTVEFADGPRTLLARFVRRGESP